MIKKLFFILLVCSVVYGQDWWDEAQIMFEEYKENLYESGGALYSWEDVMNTDDRFRHQMGAGFVPPSSKTYNVARAHLDLDADLGCKGIFVHSDFDQFFDDDALVNWATSFIGNALWTALLASLYSSNTWGQLQTFMQDYGLKNLQLSADRCNDAELKAMVQDPIYQAMSWSQKLCVNGKMTGGSSYPEAVSWCKSRAADAALGNDPAASAAEIKNCYEITDCAGDEQFLKALLGYHELVSAMKVVEGGSKRVLRYEYNPPSMDINELIDSLNVLNSAYYDSVVAIFNNEMPGSESELYSKLERYIKYLSPPGAPVDADAIKQASLSSPFERGSLKTQIVSVGSYSAAMYLLNRLENFIHSCAGSDFRVNEEEIQRYKERVSFLRKQMDHLYNSYTVINGFSSSINDAAGYLTSRATGRYIQQVERNANRIGSANPVYGIPSRGR